MAKKLNVKQVAGLPKKDTPYKAAVDTGLLVRIAPSGVKSWIVTYTVKQPRDADGNPIKSPHYTGRQRDYILSKPWGEYTDDGHLSLADAKSMAARIRALARESIDYQVQRNQMLQAEADARAEEQAAEEARRTKEQTENLTVRDLFTAWIADGVQRKDDNAELQRSFDKDVLPEIGGKAIRSVTEHDLRALLRKMVDRGVNRLTVLTSSNIKQMFLWAEKRQPWRKLLSEGNPVQLIEIEKIVSPKYDLSNERDRILSGSDISELRSKLNAMHIEYSKAENKRTAERPLERTTELAIWVMLSTICRVGELSMARWEHVDFDKSEWFIPRENTKGSIGNQSDLMVYLSQFASDQFRLLHKVTGHSEWCFPASNTDGHVCVKSMSKQIGDRQAMFKKDKDGTPRLPMKNRRHDNSLVLGDGKNGAWTPHDLRRTGATLMQSLGVPLDIIDRCQNHVLSGSKVRRHYLHHDYADEKRDAWARLGERLSLTLNPSANVTPINRRQLTN
jgi:integrase